MHARAPFLHLRFTFARPFIVRRRFSTAPSLFFPSLRRHRPPLRVASLPLSSFSICVPSPHLHAIHSTLLTPSLFFLFRDLLPFRTPRVVRVRACVCERVTGHLVRASSAPKRFDASANNARSDSHSPNPTSKTQKKSANRPIACFDLHRSRFRSRPPLPSWGLSSLVCVLRTPARQQPHLHPQPRRFSLFLVCREFSRFVFSFWTASPSVHCIFSTSPFSCLSAFSRFACSLTSLTVCVLSVGLLVGPFVFFFYFCLGCLFLICPALLSPSWFSVRRE